MANLILIGMPASGKSTLGVILAKTIGMSFVDTDLLIQEKEGTLLQDIIDANGNEYFRKIEEYVLRGLDVDNHVISTGGSAIYYPKAIEHFRKNGTVIYIEVPFEEIERRLNNISTRGITLAPGQTLKDLYDERIPLYEKYADVTLKSEQMSVEQSVESLVKLLELSGKIKLNLPHFL